MTPSRKPTLVLVELVLAMAVSLFPAGKPRAADVVWTGLAGDNNWNTQSNWQGNLVPEAQYEEVGVINNGNTAFIAIATPSAAGLVLGQNLGDSGGLEIRSGGSISFLDSTGAPTGAANIGLDGVGILDVRRGGSMSTTLLDVNAGSSVHVGTDAGAGVASLTSTGDMFLNGVTTVRGAGHTLSAAGNVTFEGNSTLIAQITSTTHSPIRATGAVALAGGFKLEFGDGFSAVPGNTWDLVDAAAISGAFSGMDLSAVPTPGPGTAYQIANLAGGTNGRVLQLQLNARLQLTIDTDTNAVSISSPSGIPFSINGYSIVSNNQILNPSQWNSLHDQSYAGWEEATPTARALSELNPNIGGSLAVGASPINLGTPYTTPASLGTPPDVQFKYSSIDDNDVVQGLVKYTGSAAFNNLLLTVDPATGNARLTNSSKSNVPLVGYSILSQSGSLLPGDGNWLSLDDQNLSSWLEANPTANALNEFFAGEGATMLGPGQALSLGGLFNSASGTRDLVLQFGLNGELTPRFGVVQYATIASGLLGDFNGDGKVDSGDYVTWRKNNGTNNALPNDNGLGAPIGAAHYQLWRSHFSSPPGAGSSLAGAGEVPEPATWAIFLICFACTLNPSFCKIRTCSHSLKNR